MATTVSQLAKRYHAASVCIKPYAVKMAAELLADSEVLVGTVCGFPHGHSSPEIKSMEAQKLMDEGVELESIIS